MRIRKTAEQIAGHARAPLAHGLGQVFGHVPSALPLHGLGQSRVAVVKDRLLQPVADRTPRTLAPLLPASEGIGTGLRRMP